MGPIRSLGTSGRVPRELPTTSNGTTGVAIAEERQFRFQKDPIWPDSLLLSEYFHGETREGLGPSHQSGWTDLAGALVAHRARATSQLQS